MTNTTVKLTEGDIENMSVSVSLSKEEFGLLKMALAVAKATLSVELAEMLSSGVAPSWAVKNSTIQYNAILDLSDQLEGC
jgi:hypothetical protein